LIVVDQAAEDCSAPDSPVVIEIGHGMVRARRPELQAQPVQRAGHNTGDTITWSTPTGSQQADVVTIRLPSPRPPTR
jgi:hypothetical protein